MSVRGERLGIAAAAVGIALLPFFGSAVNFAAAPVLAQAVPRPAALLVLLLELATYGVAAWYVLTRRPPLPELFWPAIVCATITTLAGLFGFDPLPGIAGGVALFGMTFLQGATQRAFRGEGARIILWTLLVSGALSCAIALAMVALRRPAAVFADNHGRAVGTFLNSNELAFYLVVLVAAALGIALATVRPTMRAAAIVVSFLGTFTLLMTFSRSGMVALAVAVMFLLFGFRPNGLVPAVAVLGLIGAIVLLSTDASHHNPAETLSRLTSWQAGMRTIERFPLLGVGPLGYYRTYPLVRPPDGPAIDEPIAFDPHNMALSIAAEEGLAGLGALLFLFWRFAVLMRARLSCASRPARIFSLAVCAGLIGSGVHLMLNGISLAFPVWAQFLALGLAGVQVGVGDDA